MISRVYRLIDTKRIEMKQREVRYTSNDVLIRPDYLSICAADQRYYLGNRRKEVLKEKLPMALIHEATGTVLYDPARKFFPGDKVVLIPLESNGESDIKGNYRPESKFASSNMDGFLQDLIVLPHNRLVKIPADYSVEYVFSEPLSVVLGVISGFEKFHVTKPESLGVWGDGSMGFVMGLALRLLYLNVNIYIFGKTKRKLQKFSFATKSYCIDQIPGGLSVSHAFECVGGSASREAVDQIIDMISPQGCINLLGVSEEPIPVNTRKVLDKGLRITGNSRSDRADFIKAVDLIAENEQCRKYLRMLISEKPEITDESDISHAFEQDLLNDFKTVLEWKM